MRGHVATPPALAETMVGKLFAKRGPSSTDRILFPGVGSNAPFVTAVHDWCIDHDVEMLEAVAIELDPERCDDARETLNERGVDVEIVERDFLAEGIPEDLGEFEYVVGNPPYVPVSNLSTEEKSRYDSTFETTWRRYDLYFLFFEQALSLLAQDGRLVFVTPEKFEYNASAGPLRELLTDHRIEEIEHVDARVFTGFKTYPVITTINNTTPGETRIITRDDITRTVTLPQNDESWASTIRGGIDIEDTGVTLGEVTDRISAGTATGRDALFVMNRDEIPKQLVEEGWSYPTVSGKQLRRHDGPYTDDLIACPYDENGNLLPLEELGAYADWAQIHRETLEERSCVQKRGRPWWDWHNAPPMELMLRPKIVCKDVTDEPEFWADPDGTVLPRHSVYYIVPSDGVDLSELLAYLNSEEAKAWIEAHAQNAYDDHIRIQSEVIEDLPVPKGMGQSHQATLPGLE